MYMYMYIIVIILTMNGAHVHVIDKLALRKAHILRIQSSSFLVAIIILLNGISQAYSLTTWTRKYNYYYFSTWWTHITVTKKGFL